ncbi:twitching motility protein PilT [Candidatus Scalindua japonica]|uniref:Twitching motility protein PilT n=1 Tax=Candidatus Scalindua japonica TaxID=1284222 RepID=A0A286TYX9_9BACT|nr:type IV pilus twitching motility protein PilT [Candidatus Scalindua japonica]GAX61074.1 twitching motility protein PilT [Candidatus Scalindua japonica]
MDISEILTFAKEQGASDLHISSGEPPMVRIDGDIQKVDMPSLPQDEVHSMLYDILNDQQRKVFEGEKEIDFALDIKGIARYRINAFYQSRGEAIVFRTIPTKVMTLKELGLPDVLADLTKKTKGLVLVTGPTGSGKSTTLAAMMDFINRNEKAHILTIEDPIEFVYESELSLINQRELGLNTHSFAKALRSALREDPDVILVGEMRDLETISLAMTAAETGHLVFGTLHTSSAAKTVDRVIDVFPPEQQNQIRSMFSESILAVVTQNLLKKKEGKGRIAALEILTGTPAVRNLIREGKIAQIPGMMQTGKQFGMQTMDATLAKLYKQGVVSLETVTPYLTNPSALSSYGM